MSPPPELQQLTLNFLAIFLVATLLNNDLLLVVTVHELYGPFTSPF